MKEIYVKTSDLAKWLVEMHFRNQDFVSVDELVLKLEDVSDQLEQLQESFENYKKYVESNYKELDQKEQIGWNEYW